MDQSVMFVLATFKSSKKIWSEFAISSLMTSQKTMETSFLSQTWLNPSLTSNTMKWGHLNKLWSLEQNEQIGVELLERGVCNPWPGTRAHAPTLALEVVSTSLPANKISRSSYSCLTMFGSSFAPSWMSWVDCFKVKPASSMAAILKLS